MRDQSGVRSYRRLVAPVALAAAALAAGYVLGAGREASTAQAAGEGTVQQNVRLIAVPDAGRAMVIDQSNRMYVVEPTTAKATLVVDDRGQALLVR